MCPNPVVAIRLLGLAGLLAVLVLTAACTNDGGDGGVIGGGESTSTTVTQAQPVAGGELVFVLNAESSGYNPIVDRFALQGHYAA